jgi:hypothetical protein
VRKRGIEEARAFLRELVLNDEESEEKPVLRFDRSGAPAEDEDQEPRRAAQG